MDIEIVRNHYPIGQGFFSSQQILYGNEKYTCVYDCGSVSKGGSRLLDKYVDYLRDTTEAIDLLVISHLHRDHVNGIKYLIEKFNVKKIIIPYMTLVQRIMLILEISRDIDSLKPETIREDRAFIKYVISTLTDDGEEIHIEIPGDTEVISSSFYPSTEEISLNKKGFIWEFTHFSLYSGAGENVECEFVKNFRGQCKRILGYNNIEDLRIDDLVDDLKKNKSEIVDAYKKVFKYIENKHGRKKLKDFNCSSVILYSGPHDEIWSDHHPALYRACKGWRHIDYDGHRLPWYEHHHFIDCGCYLSKCIKWGTRFGGWLGTGDARLADPENIDELKDKLGRKRLRRIQVLTVPHHGSKYNSSKYFFDIFCNSNLECVIHSDPNRGHGHPHHEVLLNIKFNGFTPISITKDESSEYAEYIDISC